VTAPFGLVEVGEVGVDRLDPASRAGPPSENLRLFAAGCKAAVPRVLACSGRQAKGGGLKKLILGGVAVVLAMGVVGAASAHTFTIRGDSKIGTFLVKRDGTLGGAIDAFGRPGDSDRNGSSCIVRWPRHGLKIFFYNLGGQNPCSRTYGYFSRARARGSHWETNRDLAIGDHQYRLRNLYPDATKHSAEEGGWWLVVRHSPYGLGGRYPGLYALMEDKRVKTLHVQFPAGGD
jgi:hypothetical protein